MKLDLEHLVNSTPLAGDKLVAGDITENVQICPIGDFPNGDKNQHCTLEALQNVVADWEASGKKEILVDFEHNAEAGGTSDTSAAAWISNLRVDNKLGLVGDFKWTDVGAQAVTNRRLRFLSVAWFVNRKTREPMKITSVALTNKPNIPVSPILNKGDADNQNVEDNKDTTMNKIKEALGLKPEATEDEVLNTVKATVKELKDTREAALNREAEDFAEKNKAKCDKEVLKAQYLANKEVAIALVAGIAEPKKDATQQVLNKDEAQSPKKDDLMKELNKLPAGEARIKFINQHAAEFAEAAK